MVLSSLNHFDFEELRDSGETVGTDKVHVTIVSDKCLPVCRRTTGYAMNKHELLDTEPPVDGAARRRCHTRITITRIRSLMTNMLRRQKIVVVADFERFPVIHASNIHNINYTLNKHIITDGDAITRVCNSVCDCPTVSLRTIKSKRLKLKSPNLAQG